MKDLLIKAITEKFIIEIVYKGNVVLIEPFTLGNLATSNKLSLSAYWVGGYSDSQSNPPWRLYHISKISTIKLTLDTFDGKREGYNPNDTRMSSIIATVKHF